MPFVPQADTEVSIKQDVKYAQFGREVKSLGTNLDQLNKVFENVRDQRQLLLSLGYGDDFGSALDTLPELTGDFTKTLQACEALLNDNSKFIRNAAGFVDNVRWSIGTEKQVKSLRDRVHFHSTKVGK